MAEAITEDTTLIAQEEEAHQRLVTSMLNEAQRRQHYSEWQSGHSETEIATMYPQIWLCWSEPGHRILKEWIASEVDRQNLLQHAQTGAQYRFLTCLFTEVRKRARCRVLANWLRNNNPRLAAQFARGLDNVSS